MTLHPPMSDADLWAEAQRRLAGAGKPRKAPQAPTPSPAPDRATGAEPARPARREKAGAPREKAPPPPPSAGSVRVVGIDPGSTTALVCVDVAMGRTGPDLDRSRWVGHAIVHPSRSTKLTEPECKASLAERIAAELRAWAPGVVVLEEPVDATGAWKNATRSVHGHGRGTLFSLGTHYGLAVMGARMAAPAARLYAYPVNNHGKGATRRPGWMQGGASRPQGRDATMARLQPMARALGCADILTEDALMAFGVLAYHLTNHMEGVTDAAA